MPAQQICELHFPGVFPTHQKGVLPHLINVYPASRVVYPANTKVHSALQKFVLEVRIPTPPCTPVFVFTLASALFIPVALAAHCNFGSEETGRQS